MMEGWLSAGINDGVHLREGSAPGDVLHLHVGMHG
jgi:hypothetical protein